MFLIQSLTYCAQIQILQNTNNIYTYIVCMYVCMYVYVTRFAKRGLIHASDFATLMRHNFICGSAMKLKFTVSLV